MSNAATAPASLKGSALALPVLTEPAKVAKKPNGEFITYLLLLHSANLSLLFQNFPNFYTRYDKVIRISAIINLTQVYRANLK